MIGYIYYLTDLTGEPRYVGQTKRNIEKRLNEHINSKKNAYRNAWIKSVGKENVRINLIEECDEFDLNEREIYYIKSFKELGFRLTNLTDGGIGKGPPNKGIPHSEESRKKMSESAKGKIISNATKLKLSIVGRGRKLSKESIEKRTESRRINRLKKMNIDASFL